jgi:NADH dehydrogenase
VAADGVEVALPPGRLPQVVVVGGGFGGLAAVRALRKARIELTLIDRQNHHLFQPLLYQVATAALNPSDIAAPLRRILRGQRNVSVLLGDVLGVDTKGQRVLLADRTLAYDFLILAPGSTHAYFGHPEWSGTAPGLKTIDDALLIRQRILLAFEYAEWAPDPAERKAWLTFVIIGGGPTGVELAGAIADIARRDLTRDFRHIDPGEAEVLLIEGGPRILPGFPERLSRRAGEALARLGVKVFTGNHVTDLDEGGVTFRGQRLEARTLLWAAGMEGSALARSLGVALDPSGRVLVQPDLSLAQAKGVYVIGDLASMHQDGLVLPALAPVADQEGRHAAANLLRALRGQPGTAFRYRSRGTLATVGRAWAVADVAGVQSYGFLAWLCWLLVHIFWLIGFRNRFQVLFEWAWTYLRFELGVRLITGPKNRPPGSKD